MIQNKKKILVIETLNIYTSIYLFIYYLLGYKIFFFRLSKNKIFKHFLTKTFNFYKKIDYQKLISEDLNFYRKESNLWIDKYIEEEFINFDNKIKFKKYFINSDKEIKIFLKKKITHLYINFFEIIGIIEKSNLSTSKIFFLTHIDHFKNYVLEGKNIKYKKIYLYDFYTIFSQILFFLKKIIYFIYKRIYYYFKKNIIYKKNINYNSQKKINNLEFLKKIIYFPHKGIYYGNEYIKDQFYSLDDASLLNYNKLSFVSLYPLNQIDINSKKFYKLKKIDIIDVNLYKKINFFINKKSLFLIVKIILFNKISLFLKKEIFLSYCRYVFYKNFLKKYTNLKGIFFDYDFLIPLELSLASRSLNIISYANQERLHLLNNPLNKLIIDNYYVISKDAERYLINHSLNHSIKKVINIGPIRTENYFNYFKDQKLIDIKFKIKNNKFDYISVVFDWHSELNYLRNAELRGNNWLNNKNFYNVILNIADKNKDILFLIKGKNYNFLKVKSFNEIKEKLLNKKNIIFANDIYQLNTYQLNAYQLISISDFSISRYSSVCEEMKFIKFPFIIFDEINFLNEEIKIDDNYVANNIEQIEKFIKDIRVNLKLHKKNNVSNFIKTKTKFQSMLVNEINNL